jgi:hypothetical protein
MAAADNPASKKMKKGISRALIPEVAMAGAG